MIDKKTFDTILGLCRFRLNEKEQSIFKNQIGDILAYVEMLESVDTKGVDPDLGKSLPLEQFRADIGQEGSFSEKLKTLTPWFENGHFIVPQILEEMDEKKKDDT